jgi:hypothetical protein
MSIALYSFKEDKNGEISVAHIFFGKTEEEATQNLKAHADICPKFGPAHKAGTTIERFVEIDHIPLPDDGDIDEFLDLEDGDDEEDEEDDDAEPEEEGDTEE